MKVKKLKHKTGRHWKSTLLTLAPRLLNAIKNAPNHVPCPVHGGTNGFRFFKDYDKTGGGICNTCGAFPNGVYILMWVNDWDFRRAARAVRKARKKYNGYTS